VRGGSCGWAATDMVDPMVQLETRQVIRGCASRVPQGAAASPLREARVGGATGRDAVLHLGGHVRGDRPRDAEGEMIPEPWRHGIVAVVGLGKSGVAATKLLARAGVRVYASDASDHPYGGDAPADLGAPAGSPLDVRRHD